MRITRQVRIGRGIATTKPELIVVDRLLELPSGRLCVLSFIEFWGAAIVVRMLGLAEGSGRELVELGFSLRDDLGREYEWSATTSGGMVLPEEVSIGFAGPVGEAAGYLEVVSRDAAIVERVSLARRSGTVAPRLTS